MNFMEEGTLNPRTAPNAKLKTIELQKQAYKEFCAHLASGKSKQSWTFIHKDLKLTSKGFENYLKDTQTFPPIDREIAEAQGFAYWEQVVADSATGKDHGKANTRSLAMIMQNKYGWDKEEKNQPLEEKKDQCQSTLDKISNHLDTKAQSDLKIAANSVKSE